MKRYMFVLAGLATLGVAAFLANQLLAQGPAQPTQTGSAPPAVKIGLVNLTAVVKGFEKSKTYKDELEKVRLIFEKKHADFQVQAKKYADFMQDPKSSQADKDKVEGYMKQLKRLMEDNQADGNKELDKRGKEFTVQMFKEVEDAVASYARPNGFHIILHYSEPVTDADKYSPENIQRKLSGSAQTGCVSPLYHVGGIDVSADIVNTLNSKYRPSVPATAPPTGGLPK